MHNCAPCRAPRIWQDYRGFALVGRCGTGTVRSGGKAHGKIRHFWNEGRVFLGREACLARGRVENTCRMRGSTPTLPPWPIDCCPKMPHLPAMAAKWRCHLAFGACLWGGAICAHRKTRHFGHTIKRVNLDTSGPHFAAMADRLLLENAPSIGHGGQTGVFPRI